MVHTVAALSLDDERKLYEKAKANLSSGHIQSFLQQAELLKDYPLYPYLEYRYLKSRLSRLKPEAMERFFHNHSDLPDADGLRIRWLKLLAARKDWDNYLRFYVTQKDPLLNCQHLIARINTGQTTYLLEDIRSAWLIGESMPKECDPAFEMLYQSPLMDSELIWQRIALAMENGNTGLANFLGRKLNGDKKFWQQRWLEMHQKPLQLTQKPSFADTAEARQILIYGIQRLIKRHIREVIPRWQYIKDQYDFMPAEIKAVERQLAIRAAQKELPEAKQLLDAIDTNDVDSELLRWRIHFALQDEDWPLLLKWTNSVPADKELANPWWYWHGRAQEEMGEITAAKFAWRRIATERDYYGFMAADRLGWTYRMNHFPLPDELSEKQKIKDLPAMQRAYELDQLGKHWQSRREWGHAINRMSRFQMQVAATVAEEWGWHFQTIAALGKARMLDDLVLRFPLRHRELFTRYADKRSLDLGWIYGLVRAESAFIEDARSPVGALGLMQVMPATGKEVARSLGMKKFHKNQLLKAETNVPIGSQYLKQMLARFDNNMAMATAAYNAGPHRIKKWRPKERCMATDVWVELIPFKETRKYVKRVLSYASIYDWRLQEENIPRLSERLAVITPAGEALACETLQVSQQ